MLTSLCLLSCALTVGQPASRTEWQLTPQLAPGLELVYTGVYLDENLIPNAQHVRQYRLEAHMLVLDAGIKDWHVAFMTALNLQDAQQLVDKKPTGPGSMRLDTAKVDWQARPRTLDKKLLEIPLHGPATQECGFLAPVPTTKVGRGFSWEVKDAGQPTQHWQVLGTEVSAGVTCVKIAGVQQSDDWDRGRADKAAWRRRDIVWLHPQFNVAQKVERLIEHRGAARETPTHRSVVRYELDSHLTYPGRSFEERKNDVLKAIKFHEDAQQLLRQPVLHRGQADSLIQRVSFHLDHPQTQQTTPYRKAMSHVKTLLEKAKQGDVPAPLVKEDPTGPMVKAIEVGQRVPDFAVSSFTDEKATQLKGLGGKAVLVVFYNPSTSLGGEVLTFAKALSEQQPDRLAIMAMAVTPDAEIARKQHKDMRLTFPILDGNGLRLTFGAVETPRFVVVDCDGFVRLAQTGWGFHSPREVTSMLQRCYKK